MTGDDRSLASSSPNAATAIFQRIRRSSSWAGSPPVLSGAGVTLREAVPDDAGALIATVGREAVARIAGATGSTLDDLATRFEAARAERVLGHEVCLVIVPRDCEYAVGLFRIREAEPGFGSAEWQFAVAPEYWGRGLFFHAASLVVDFVFDVIGAHRLEARAAVLNGRGTGALRKLGAVREAVLRQSLPSELGYDDEVLWSIIADDWYVRTGHRTRVH